jgi:hypothetical protein
MEVYHREIPDVVYRQRKMTIAGTILYAIQGLILLAIKLRIPLRASIISECDLFADCLS